jgi:hypothetical protein
MTEELYKLIRAYRDVSWYAALGYVDKYDNAHEKATELLNTFEERLTELEEKARLYDESDKRR